MRRIWFLFTCMVLVRAAVLQRNENGKKVRYDDFSVYKLYVNNDYQLSIINKLSSQANKYNIWKDYDVVSKEVHIMVHPEHLEEFFNLCDTYKFEKEIMIENVQRLIDEEKLSARQSSFDWTRYYEYDEIENWLDNILAAYSNVTSGFIVGQSYEGRSIRGIKIARNDNNPGIFIESNVHAREWITSASATWFINQLLTSEEAQIKNLAENYNWYIVPVYNVDGFVYTHKTDRMWRKTRQPHSESKCIGVDANRNFDSHWLENDGASPNPCDETFAGSKPWSEPEAKALADYVHGIKNNLNLYISFHSYGQYLLSPYGHTDVEFPENYDDLLSIGSAFVNAIKGLSYGTNYVHGSTGSVLYVASGTSVDYMFNEVGIKLAYTIEFRDKGRYGFVLPPVQILPNCEELMSGIIALIEKAKDLKYF